MIIAIDVDGTLYDGAHVAPAAGRALARAKMDGHLLVVVSGRRWSDLPVVLGPVLALFDLVVGEEGGILADVSTGEVTLLAAPIEPRLVDALRNAQITDLAVGQVVVGAPTRFAGPMSAARDAVGSTRRLVTNKASVALVPPGCDKASGLRAAIDVLDAHRLPILAIGDAENDLPMFEMATYAVAVANADEAVRRAGLARAALEHGDGVAEIVNGFLDRDGDDPWISARGLSPTR